MSEEETVCKVLGEKMVKVQVTLYEPFYNFIKEYLAFFGSEKTIEDFCRKTVYDTVCLLYNELGEFVSDQHRLIEGKEWYEKWPHISSAAFKESEETEES